MSHLARSILVFERRSQWEADLKRSLADRRVLVRPCRSAADLLELCRAMPGSVAVIDLETGAATVLRCLEQALRQRLSVTALVIAQDHAADLEWPLRELGAAAVLSRSIAGDALAALCWRNLTAS
ncbi:MAG: hypothetical protein ACKV0T_21330 [Planctomycetales bacterium]